MPTTRMTRSARRPERERICSPDGGKRNPGKQSRDRPRISLRSIRATRPSASLSLSRGPSPARKMRATSPRRRGEVKNATLHRRVAREVHFTSPRSHSSFRGAPTGPRKARPDDRLRASPESITTTGSMDSGPAPSGASRNDVGGVRLRIFSTQFLQALQREWPTRLGKNSDYGAGVARSVTTASYSAMLAWNVCKTSGIERRAEARPQSTRWRASPAELQMSHPTPAFPSVAGAGIGT
jgi:hypothetical protein